MAGGLLTSAEKILAFGWTETDLDAAAQVKLNAETVSMAMVRTAGTFTANSPGAGSIAWANVKIEYQGSEYTITDGNTAAAYLYWTVGDNHFHSGAAPAFANNNFQIAINAAGTPIYQDMPGQQIYAARVVCDKLSAISADIGDITAGTIDGIVITGTTIKAGVLTDLDDTTILDTNAHGEAVLDNCHSVTARHGGDNAALFPGGLKVSGTYVVQSQQAHIINADGNLADITTKFNTLLSELEAHGLIASA